MNSDLDELLKLGEPRLAARTRDVGAELDRLVAVTEGMAASPRRSRRRLAVGGIALAAMLGGVAGANAGGFVDLIPGSASGNWFSDPGTVEHEFTLSSGDKCVVTYAVEPSEVEGVARLRSGMSADDWAAGLREARAAMNDPKTSEVDLAAAIARFADIDDATREQLKADGMPAAERSPALTPDQTQVLAFGNELLSGVKDRLREHGYDPSVVTIASVNDCRELS
jgi:hypothetical protein